MASPRFRTRRHKAPAARKPLKFLYYRYFIQYCGPAGQWIVNASGIGSVVCSLERFTLSCAATNAFLTLCMQYSRVQNGAHELEKWSSGVTTLNLWVAFENFAQADKALVLDFVFSNPQEQS